MAVTWAAAAAGALAALAAYLAWHFVVYGRNKGPTIWPVVGSLPSIAAHFDHFFDWSLRNLQEHGTWRAVLPGMVRYFTADPRNVEHILKTRFANYPKGAMFESLLADLLGGGIFNADGASWRAQRKAASYEFAARSLRDLIVASLRAETGGRLVPLLRAAAADGRQLDLQDVFGRFTFDSICQIGFGIDPGCLRPELPLVPFAKAFDTANLMTAVRMKSSPAMWRLKRALRIGTERVLYENMRVVNAFTADLIARRTRELAPGGGGAPAGGGEGPVAGSRGGKEKSGGGSPKSVLSARPLLEKEGEGGGGARGGEERVDLLSRFVQMAADSDNGFPASFLQDVVSNFIIAGRDTSAAGLTWLFWLLSQHPEVEEKIVQEARGVLLARPDGCPASSASDMAGGAAREPPPASVAADQWPAAAPTAGRGGDGAPAGPGERDARCQPGGTGECGARSSGDSPGGDDTAMFTYEELKESMPYLHAAVSEALRLYPPVPIELKVAVEADELPDGTRVPAGALVSFDLYSMARLETVWGPDCCEFRPERWLDAAGRFVAQSSFRFPVFLAGPRACLGREMAYLLMKIATASLLLRFRFLPAAAPAAAAAGKREAAVYKPAITLMKNGGLPVTVSAREGAGDDARPLHAAA